MPRCPCCELQYSEEYLENEHILILPLEGGGSFKTCKTEISELYGNYDYPEDQEFREDY